MKVLMLLSLLTLASCGSGYEVRGPYESRIAANSTVYYNCIHIKPIFFNNITIKQCDTLKECNDFCEEKRQADK